MLACVATSALGGEHRGTLHRSAVVGVEYPATQVDAGILATNAFDERGGELVALDVVDLPVEDLAAPHVLDEVQVEELPAHATAKVRDVPRAHLPRSVGDVLARMRHRRARPPTVMLHVLLAEHAIEGRLRCDGLGAVGQARNDLARRVVANSGLVATAISFLRSVSAWRCRSSAGSFHPGTPEGPTAAARAMLGAGAQRAGWQRAHAEVTSNALGAGAMKPKRPSAQYMTRARALAEAIDIGVKLSASLPRDERDAMVKGSLEWKRMALEPRPGFASTRSLAFLEQAFFTYWNEASGKQIERFWQLVGERGLPFQRKDAIHEILHRGRIKNELDYELVTDAMVIQRQMGRISQAEEDELSGMLGDFEKRATTRRKSGTAKKRRSH